MYSYVKALHIIFIVTWFSGMFYIVRLFIYNTEANEKPEPEKSILQQQSAYPADSPDCPKFVQIVLVINGI